MYFVEHFYFFEDFYVFYIVEFSDVFPFLYPFHLSKYYIVCFFIKILKS